jgi:hypothetical protein
MDVKLTFAFGHLVGNGIQKLLSGDSLQNVILEELLAWPLPLEYENEKQKKSFYLGVGALIAFENLKEDQFADWEVAEFNGRKACELGFKITMPNGMIFRGFIDLVLRHRISGAIRVLEVKTSSANTISEEMYKNSSQALGYSVVVDKIAPEVSDYEVLYLPWLTKHFIYSPMLFTKSLDSRVSWLLDILLESQRIQSYQEVSHFPKHGESCLSRFGKVCGFYNVCNMNPKFLAKPYNPTEDKETKVVYDFEFTFEELLESQQAKLVGGN